MNDIKKYQVYSEREKEIFNNVFVNHSESSRKIFEDYVNEYFETLPGKKKPNIRTVREEDSRCSNQKVTTLSNPEKISYNTNNMIWEEKHKDNLVTHFLSDSDFKVTSTNLYSLNRLHPNWNHQNKDGLNALMYLAIRKNLEFLNQVANDLKLDLNQQDKDHKYFTHFLFSEIDSEPLSSNFFSRLNGHFSHIEKLIDNNPLHFQISHVRLGRLINEWEGTMKKLRQNFENDENAISFAKARENIEIVGSRILSKIFNQKLEFILKDKIITKPVTSKI